MEYQRYKKTAGVAYFSNNYRFTYNNDDKICRIIKKYLFLFGLMIVA